jgi:ribosomal protein S18 acetylase RimI-like enzyme
MSLDSLLAFTRRTTELTADEVRTIDGGWIFSAPSIPFAWGLNHVRLQAPMEFDVAVKLADEAQSDLAFRRIVLEQGALSAEIEEQFLGAGWRAERDLLMQLEREPGRRIHTAPVVLADEQQQLELAYCWSREAEPRTTDDVLEQLSRYWLREWRTLGDRAFGIPFDGSGRLEAKARLRSNGTIAQVEDVYTRPEARGRGYASTLIRHAVELARAEGHETIFIVADDDDWPKLLYRRLGFEPIGRVVSFHRQLS